MKQHTAATRGPQAPSTATAFDQQVARDWQRFKEKYFACTEYPDVRRALKKILDAEEKAMTKRPA